MENIKKRAEMYSRIADRYYTMVLSAKTPEEREKYFSTALTYDKMAHDLERGIEQ